MRMKIEVAHLKDIIESGHADSQTYDILNRLAFRHNIIEDILAFYSQDLPNLGLAQKVDCFNAQKKLQSISLSQLNLSASASPSRLLPTRLAYGRQLFFANFRTKRFLTWIMPSLLLIISVWLILGN